MVLTPAALRASLQQRDIPRVNAVGHHLIKGQNCTFPYLHIQMPASRYMQHLSTRDMISQVSIGNMAYISIIVNSQGMPFSACLKHATQNRLLAHQVALYLR